LRSGCCEAEEVAAVRSHGFGYAGGVDLGLKRRGGVWWL
jgi:hypothetical protein